LRICSSTARVVQLRRSRRRAVVCFEVVDMVWSFRFIDLFDGDASQATADDKERAARVAVAGHGSPFVIAATASSQRAAGRLRTRPRPVGIGSGPHRRSAQLMSLGL
jgi:hypothetical protein